MTFSRNWLFINDNLQTKISEKTIFFAGVGLGSQIAISLARLGFHKFILADGDIFTQSNLNRQHCFLQDLGKNKADTTANYIQQINPQAQIESLPFFLDENNLPEYIKKSDYIVNCIDFDSPAYLECHRLCKLYNKKEIFVINLGFGSVAAISNHTSPQYDLFLNENDYSKLKDKLIYHFITQAKLSDTILQKFTEYQNHIGQKPEPQLVYGCFASSILVSKIIVNDIEGEKNNFFPYIYSLDFN